MRDSDEYQTSALDLLMSPRRSGLGDLTETKKAERGEFDQITGSDPTELPTQTIPPAPKIQSGVMPCYDTLPANGGKFSFGQLLGVSGVVAQSNLVVFTQQVPAGRVLFARNFRVNIEDTFSAPGPGSFPPPTFSLGIPTIPYSVTLYVNGNAEVFNQQIFVQAMDDYYPCSLYAGPLDIVTIAVSFDFTALPSPPGVVEFITHLNGDMLLPNELSTPYTGLRQTAMPVFDVSK